MVISLLVGNQTGSNANDAGKWYTPESMAVYSKKCARIHSLPDGRMGERKAWKADWPGPRIGDSRPPVKEMPRASCGGELCLDGT